MFLKELYNLAVDGNLDFANDCHKDAETLWVEQLLKDEVFVGDILAECLTEDVGLYKKIVRALIVTIGDTSTLIGASDLGVMLAFSRSVNLNSAEVGGDMAKIIVAETKKYVGLNAEAWWETCQEKNLELGECKADHIYKMRLDGETEH